MVSSSQGTLYLTGPNGPDRIQHCGREGKAWEDIEVPLKIVESIPQDDDRVLACWNQFFREFVADVRGEGYEGYPTFRDGCIACEIIETVISNRSRVRLSGI